MPETKHNAVIDTNLWISFLPTKNYERIDQLFALDRLTVLVSQELLDEIVEVAGRPKFRKYFDLADFTDLLASLRQKAMLVTVSATIDACRDAKDNFLLSLAVDGAATHILTGDRGLLVLHPFGDVHILTIGDYLATV